MKFTEKKIKFSPIESCRTPTELMFDVWPMEKGCVMPGYEVAPI